MSSGRNPAALLAVVALCLLALLTIFYARRLWRAAQVGDTFIAAPEGKVTTLQIQEFVILALVWFITRRPSRHGFRDLDDLAAAT